MQDDVILIERSVLSSIFYANDTYDLISPKLIAKDFLLTQHQAIFEVMNECEKQNLPIDPHIILPKANGRFSEADINEILSTSPLGNIQVYANEIKEASNKRKLQRLASNIHNNSDSMPSTQDVVDMIEKELSDISLSNESDFKNSKEIVSNALERLEFLKRRGNLITTGLATGFNKLDILTSGFNEGDLIIIGARPSMGKTAFSLNIAQSILDSGVGVAFFALEMSAQSLVFRMLSSLTSINLQDLSRGNMNDEEWEILSKNAQKLADQELFVDDSSFLSISLLRTKLRKLKRTNPGVGVAIIDYLGLMSGINKSAQNRVLEISEITRGLKTLARELKIPIIALAQLNRSLESRDDRRPILADLRESGSIEQDADKIMFIYRDSVYKQQDDKQRLAKLKKEGKEKEFKPEYEQSEVDKAEIIISKNRNGETRTIFLHYHPRFVRFENRPEDVISMPANTNFTPYEEYEGRHVDMDILNQLY